MSYRIVVDSCCDLTDEDRKSRSYSVVPLTLIVGQEEIIDDETFSQADFLRKVRECSECPKSACPSPQRYMQEYETADDIYVVTLSSKLSGSYDSAQTGRKMYIEEYGEKNIHVFDSCSAASGELLLARLILEKAESGMTFSKVVEEVEAYRKKMVTYFVLENLETLKKNGRLTGMKAVLATTLNIKPVMKSTPEGTIEKAGQSRGFFRALEKMAELVGLSTKADQPKRRAVISHCNNMKGALLLQQQLEKCCSFQEIVITEAAGVTSMYANDGGVVVSA